MLKITFAFFCLNLWNTREFEEYKRKL